MSVPFSYGSGLSGYHHLRRAADRGVVRRERQPAILRRDAKTGDVVATLVHDVQPLPLTVQRQRARIVTAGPDIVLVAQPAP